MKVCRDFESKYDIDQEWESTGIADETRRLFYPAGAETGWKDGLVIRVVPVDGEAWVGCFAPGPTRAGLMSQAMSCPDPKQLCVISGGAGYIVQVDHPDKWESVRAIPVCEVRAIWEKQLMVFSDYTKLVAYGVAGLRWESSQVSSDGIDIVDIHPERIDVVGWDAAEQKDLHVLLGLDDGSIIARS